MKNRRIELGRPIKLGKVAKPAPPQFLDWLYKAIDDGNRFAPNFLELCPRDSRKAMREQMDIYKSLCRQNTAVCNAVMAVFHYSLAQTILVNPDEPSWLIKKALFSSVESQNRLVQAFLGLLDNDRKILLSLGKHADFNPVDWTFYYQGSMAVARFAQATIKCGVNIRFAQAYHDINHKIDVFCESLWEGSLTLCIQIKSHGNRRGCEFSVLTSDPADNAFLNHEDFRVLKGIWRGVQDFNRLYKRNWTPVLAKVGFAGTSLTQIFDERLEKDVSDFFRNSIICQNIDKLNSFDFPLLIKTACA